MKNGFVGDDVCIDYTLFRVDFVSKISKTSNAFSNFSRNRLSGKGVKIGGLEQS